MLLSATEGRAFLSILALELWPYHLRYIGLRFPVPSHPPWHGQPMTRTALTSLMELMGVSSCWLKAGMGPLPLRLMLWTPRSISEFLQKASLYHQGKQGPDEKPR